MNIFILLLLVAVGPMTKGFQTEIVQGSIQSKQLIIRRDRTDVQIERRSFQAKIDLGNGQTGKANILIVYESKSGLFWWRYILGEPGEVGSFDHFVAHSVFSITDNKIVCFNFDARTLRVAESAFRFSSLAEGQAKVLERLESERGKVSAAKLDSLREVAIGKSLPFTFYSLNGNSNFMLGPKLREVSFANPGWQVTLDGPNGDGAIVLLNDNYEVISSRVIPRNQAP